MASSRDGIHDESGSDRVHSIYGKLFRRALEYRLNGQLNVVDRGILGGSHDIAPF